MRKISFDKLTAPASSKYVEDLQFSGGVDPRNLGTSFRPQ